jgi:hypothetical protein
MMTSKRAEPTGQTATQAKGGGETVSHMVATTAGVAPKVHGLSAANLLDVVTTKPPLPPAGGDGGNSSGGASNASGGGGDNAGGAAKKS